MSIPALANLFYEFDKFSKGYLTIDEIQNLHKEINIESIDIEHVYLSIQKLTGDRNTPITLSLLPNIMLELRNRMLLENDLRWTFRSLANIERKIAIDDALLLFRACQGENFRMETWYDFLNSRTVNPKSSPVYFDEIKLWLINEPLYIEKSPPPKNWVEEEIQKLRKENEQIDKAAIEAYLENVAKHPNGRDIGPDSENTSFSENPNLTGENEVTYRDVMDLVNHKYTTIRNAVITAMSDYLPSKTDIIGTDFESLRRNESQLRKSGKLAEHISDLGEIQEVNVNFNIDLLMDTVEASFMSATQAEEKDEMTKNELAQMYPGQDSFGELLVALWERECKEKAALESWLLSDSGDDDEGGSSTETRIAVAYSRMLKQIKVFQECGENLQCGLISAGLAERKQKFEIDEERPSADRYRQEIVSLSELVQSAAAQALPQPALIKEIQEGAGRKELLYEIVHQLVESAHKERKALGFYFNGVLTPAYLTAARKLSLEVRHTRLEQILIDRSIWRDQESGALQCSIDTNHKLLQEATVLRWVIDEADNIDNAPTSLIASLRGRQDEVFDDIIDQLPLMKAEDLLRVRYEISLAAKNRLYDNLAFVLFDRCGSVDDQLLLPQAVGRKYSALKRKIFEVVCRYNHEKGESSTLLTDWDSLDIECRDRSVCRLIGQEFLLRQSKAFKEIEYLIPSPLQKTFSDLSWLIGPSRPTADRLKVECEHKDESGKDYMKDYRCKEYHNVLTGLAQREEEELKDIAGTHDSFRRDLLHERLCLETLYISLELSPSSAFIISGLLERIDDFKEKASFFCQSDITRLGQLTYQHITDRNTQPQVYTKLLQKTNDDFVPHHLEDSETLWFELFMKHLYERPLIALPTDKELRKMSSFSSEEEHLAQRLTELREKHNRLRFEIMGDSDKNLQYISQSICCWLLLNKMRNPSMDSEKLLDQLRESLEHVQLKDIQHVYEAFLKMTPAELSKEVSKQHNARIVNFAENIFVVIANSLNPKSSQKSQDLETDGTSVEQQLDSELAASIKAKYDTLREQLYLDSLVAELGESVWSSLPQKQRHHLLHERRLLTRQLEREGRLKELTDLLGVSDELEKALKVAFPAGEGGQVASTSEEGGEGEGETVMGSKKKTILGLLTYKSDMELEDILRQLNETKDKEERERLRQLALIKLRREQRLLGHEDSLLAMSMLMSLAGVESKLADDRNRNLELARERLAAARARRLLGLSAMAGSSSGTSEALSSSVDGGVSPERLHEAILAELDFNQAQERLRLIEMMDDEKAAKWFQESFGQCNWEELMTELEVLWQSYLDARDSGASQEHIDSIIEESRKACVIQLALNQLSNGTDIEEVKVTCLINLQMMQDRTMTSVTERLADIGHDEDKLMGLLNSIKLSKSNDLVSLIFVGLDTTRLPTDYSNEIENEVDKKYELIRTTILEEALIAKFGGQPKWDKLSDEERSGHLARFKVEHKRLIDAGKEKEAADMLTELLEFDQHDEVAVQRRRNILDDLDRTCQGEKDKLLAQLDGQTSAFEKERLRQLILARVKQQQKEAKLEDSLIASHLLFEAQRIDSNHLKELDHAAARARRLAIDRLNQARQNRQQNITEAAIAAATGDKGHLLGGENSPHATMQETIDRIVEFHSRVGQVEEDLLLGCLDRLIEQPKKVKQLVKKSKKDLQEQLIGIERKIDSLPKPKSNPSDGSPNSLQNYLKEAEQIRNKRNALLRESVLIKTALTMQQLSIDDAHSTAVRLLTSLSQVQGWATQALDNRLMEEGEQGLQEIMGSQRTALLEGRHPSLRTLLFGNSRDQDGEASDGGIETFKRENTLVLESREQTQEKMDFLIKNQEKIHRKIEMDRRRQEMKVKDRINRKANPPSLANSLINQHKEQQRIIEERHQDSLSQTVHQLNRRRKSLTLTSGIRRASIMAERSDSES